MNNYVGDPNVVKLFVFDTETTGLFKDSDTLTKMLTKEYDLDLAPKMLSTAYSVVKMIIQPTRVSSVVSEHMYDSGDIYVNRTVEIPKEAFNVNGITQEYLLEHGKTFKDVVAQMVAYIKACDIIVAHNAPYDVRILAHAINEVFHDDEKLRKEALRVVYSKEVLCTAQLTVMFMSTEVGNNYGSNVKTYKRKSLRKLYKEIFGVDFANAHNASADKDALVSIVMKLDTFLCEKVGIDVPATSVIDGYDNKTIEYNLDLYHKSNIMTVEPYRINLARLLFAYQRLSLQGIYKKWLFKNLSLFGDVQFK